MLNNLKGMIVVMAIALVIFRFAKPIALLFSSEEDFSRRRNIWLILTATAFISPSFWWYALVAIPLLIWAAQKDKNPIALYIFLLQVVPSIPVDIPVIGINELFSLDNYRLLSFCVLIPTAWRLNPSKVAHESWAFAATTILLAGYGLLQALQVPPNTSWTAILRGAFLFYIDVFILYYTVSRYCASRDSIIEVMAAFCLACCVMSAQAIFEAARHWLPYADIIGRWAGHYLSHMYLFRGDALRAEASAGHSLALGVLLALAFGCWLYVSTRFERKYFGVVGGLLLWLGLVAAYSRAPWLGALTIYILFTTLGPRPWSRVLKAVLLMTLTAVVVLMSPLGERFIKVLPFLGGSVDAGGIDYRQRLAERSWELFQAHPFFGDVLVLSKMEDLRQGQGIIDFVNGYAYIGLFYGGVGLALFLSPALISLWRAYRLSKSTRRSDPSRSLLGAALIATILGEMLLIATSGLGLGPEKVFYVLIGLSAAYGNFCHSPSSPKPT